jgi:signal transduction histidine kinase
LGTKLRNFSLSRVTKAIAFALAAALIAALAALTLYLYYMDIPPESLVIAKYKDSRAFTDQVETALSQAYYTLDTGAAPTGTVPYYYYISDIRGVWTNSDDTGRQFFEQYGDACYILENGEWTFGPGTNPAPVFGYYGDKMSHNRLYTKIYIAFSDDYMALQQQKWEEGRSGKLPYAVAAAACMVLLILLIIYLIIAAGRSPDDKELHLNKLDGIFTDIQAAALVLIILLWYVTVKPLLQLPTGYFSTLSTKEILSIAFMAIVTAIASTLCGLILLSQVRKLKAGNFIKHSLIYKVLYWMYDYIRSLFDGRAFDKYPLTRSLFYRQLIFISASFAFVFLTFVFFMLETYLILLPPILEIVMIYWYIKGNNKTFGDINKGFDISLREQIKSERMKVALITNVSHDLKTPLTSIISYVDLLSKEESLSDTARDYVRILAEKSQRLSNMVSDLFDLAKSSSGNMPVDIEDIDLKKLIEQTLADMGDKVGKSELVMKVGLPENPVYISADGKKLYRVFQNVIDNALKYSFKGTRVYMTLEEMNGQAVATVKNTAGYEMDFTAEEILQRFTRGDKSRTTEGSGLGLSIAESFTHVCGGAFKVDIDGDLFKVTISFPVSQQNKTVLPSAQAKPTPAVPQ